MSWQPGQDPIPGDSFSCSAIEHVIVPRARDIGAFEVRRALPSAQKQMVGPFIFFDQMGPAEFLLGHGVDVRPHPHIGLATVTYLFEGEIWHRDSLGTVRADPARRGQPGCRPGAASSIPSARPARPTWSPRQASPVGETATARPPVRHPDLGGPAEAARRRPPPSSTTAPTCCPSSTRGQAREADRGTGFGAVSPLATASARRPLRRRAARGGRAGAGRGGIRGACAVHRRRHDRGGGRRVRAPGQLQPLRPGDAITVMAEFWMRGSRCSAARRWMGRATSGGTSCRPPRADRGGEGGVAHRPLRPVPGDEKEIIPLPGSQIRVRNQKSEIRNQK